MNEIEKPKTIAIVGNSPILLEKEYGEEIDAHDEVLRFNAFQIDGFEKCVGKKTTMYAFANSCKNPNEIYKSLPSDHIFFRFGVDYTSKQFSEKLKELTNGKLKKNEIICLDKKYLQKATNNVDNGSKCFVSTGIAVLMYMCEKYAESEIDVYGFSFFEGNGQMHYFENKKVNVPHPFKREQEYFNSALSKKIKIHK